MSIETLTHGAVHVTDIVFFVTGIVGMVTHYFKKVVKKETDAKMCEWYGKSNMAATITTLGVFFASMIGALGSGIIVPEMNIYAVMYAGFTTGFAIDSGFNSDQNQTKVISDNKDAIQKLNSK